MTDTTTPNDGGDVIDFARRTGRTGFNLTPTTIFEPPVIAPPAPPVNAPSGSAAGGRRSPLDIVSALPDPGILQPPITAPAPTPTGPGHVPATFRAEPAPDMVGPRLGALSLAAILAVAVAALRGSHTVLSTWWENRLARQAETDQLREARLKHQLAMQNIGDKATQQRAKQSSKVPSSSEFGRKTLGSRSGGSGGGSGAGKGPGRSGKGTGTSSGSGAGTGPARKKTPSAAGQKTSGGSLLNGSGKGGAGRGPGRKNHKTSDGPLRTHQRAGAGLKKNKPTPGPTSDPSTAKKTPKGRQNGRTTLPDALAKDTSKSAARRLKKRRKNLDNPALWTDSKDKAGRGKKQPGKDLAPTTKPDGPTNGPKSPNGPKTGSKKQRTRLADAMTSAANKAARKRLKRRRRTVTPPIWSAPRNRTNKKNTGKDAPNRSGRGRTADRAKAHAQRIWDKARAYTRSKAARDGCFDGTTGPQAGPHTPPPGTGHQGPRGGRRSPFENAGQAAPHTEWTVERADHAGAQSTTWHPDALTTGTAALDPAPTPHTKRPGTTRPKEPRPMPPAPARREDPRITKARKQAARTGNHVVTAARHMDAQHETEITLDDALDEYSAFAADGFKTHDQCVKLAARATKLRDVLALFTADLATNHNLIGVLFTGAMARMTESMDLVARMAEEMQTSSLEAAEQAEAADNDLNDTYRPITQATADAGLTTPSAPIHNQE